MADKKLISSKLSDKTSVVDTGKEHQQKIKIKVSMDKIGMSAGKIRPKTAIDKWIDEVKQEIQLNSLSLDSEIRMEENRKLMALKRDEWTDNGVETFTERRKQGNGCDMSDEMKDYISQLQKEKWNRTSEESFIKNIENREKTLKVRDISIKQESRTGIRELRPTERSSKENNLHEINNKRNMQREDYVDEISVPKKLEKHAVSDGSGMIKSVRNLKTDDQGTDKLAQSIKSDAVGSKNLIKTSGTDAPGNDTSAKKIQPNPSERDQLEKSAVADVGRKEKIRKHDFQNKGTGQVEKTVVQLNSKTNVMQFQKIPKNAKLQLTAAFPTRPEDISVTQKTFSDRIYERFGLEINVAPKDLVGVALILLSGILAFLLFLYATRITSIKVEPGAHYSKNEVKEMIVSDSFWDKNAIFLFLKYRYAKQPEIPFVEKFDVELAGWNQVEIITYDKKIIGCTEYMNEYIYFDKDGMFVETASEVKDKIPYVSGIDFENIVIYKKMKVADKQLFRTIIAITQQISKYKLEVTEIQFDKESNVTLYMGKIRVRLGKKSAYEEQLSQIKNMIHQANAENLSGVLHLENYSDGKRNYIFDKNE